MKPTLTLIAPTCTCCPEPTALLPRDDLAAGWAVCARSGRLYRPEGGAYVPTRLPDLTPPEERPVSVQIDLSQSGYA